MKLNGGGCIIGFIFLYFMSLSYKIYIGKVCVPLEYIIHMPLIRQLMAQGLFSFLVWVKSPVVLYVICNISVEWLHLYWLRVLAILRENWTEEVKLWYPIHQILVLYSAFRLSFF